MHLPLPSGGPVTPGGDGDRRPAAPAPLALDRVSRVLVVRPDNIGDVVMLAPALRAVRSAAPAARIALLASPAGSRAAGLLPWVDEVLTERVSWQQLPGGRAPWDGEADRRLVARLRAGRFDAALVFTSFSQTPWPAAYACLLAGIPVRAAQAADFGGAVLTHVVAPAPAGTHQAERSLHLVRSLGVPVRDARPKIVVPASARAEAAAGLRREGLASGEPYVVLAPGASCEARRYPVDRFAAVARAIDAGVAGSRLRPVLVGGPEDVERLTPVAGAGGVVSLAGRTTVPQLAAVIAGAAAVVTSHSAPMHLADALGVPTVVLFSGTDAVGEWGPRRARAAVLGRPVPCAPCRGLTCPIGLPCLDIPPDEVVDALAGLLRADRPTTATRTGSRRRRPARPGSGRPHPTESRRPAAHTPEVSWPRSAS